MPTLADWLTSRIPPNSLEAERAVLGVALLDRAGPAALCRTLRAEDFYAEKHRHIYAGIAALLTAQSAVDLLTLPETLRQQGHLEEIGGAPGGDRGLRCARSPTSSPRHRRGPCGSWSR